MPGSHPTRWIVLILCSALSALGCVGSTDAPQGETGSLSLDLVIGDGIVINEVEWRITGNDMDMEDTIDVSAPGSTASVEVFGLPPGKEDYTVMLTATSVDKEVTCKGSADFNVEIGETTPVLVILNCKLPRRLGAVRVNGEFNICAELIKMVVSPLVTSIGNDIDLQSQGVDQDGNNNDITYSWTGDGGSFDDPSAKSTTYTCLEVGVHDITVRVTDNDEFCKMATWTVPIECVPSDGDPCDGNTCDDNDTECNDSSCDPANGQCVDEPINDDGACEDGTGTCMESECVDNCLDVTCDDLGECIANECNPFTGECEEFNLDGEFCEDKTGVCKDGGCIITDLCEINICDENDTECNDSMCDPETGNCVDKPINEEGACDDGTGTCFTGECVDNCLDVTCDDLGECIANECNPLTSSCEEINLDGDPCENETGVCKDGACIITDLCEVNICDEDDTECNDSMCDPETGNCVDTPINEEGACDDGTGICLAGECIPVECIDGTDCELGEICFDNDCRGDPDLFCDEGLCAESPALKEECVEGFLVCLAENPVDEECIAASFIFCAECVADPGCEEGFVCIDNVCVQPLPPILDAGSGTTTTNYECFIEGTVSLTLAVDVHLFLLSDGTGTVDIEYDVRAREVGSFLLGGVAAETNILVAGSVPVPPFEGPCDQPPLPTTLGCEFVGPTEVVTTVANGSATGALAPGAIQTSLDLGVPPLNLNNFLIPFPPVYPPFVEIVLASMIDPPLANVCDGTVGPPPATHCPPGNVPIGWQPTSEFVQPDAAGTDVDFQVGGINLIISAVGGGLILPVSTNDPTICDPNDTVVGPPISIPAVAQ